MKLLKLTVAGLKENRIFYFQISIYNNIYFIRIFIIYLNT